jgi:hypothetical protein
VGGLGDGDEMEICSVPINIGTSFSPPINEGATGLITDELGINIHEMGESMVEFACS